MKLSDFKEAVLIKNISQPITPVHAIDFETVHLFKDGTSARSKDFIVEGKDYFPQPKDKLFFYPGCNVLRHKVREWGKPDKISITIKQENATAEFISAQTIKEMLTDLTMYKIPMDIFLKFLAENYPQGTFDVQLQEIMKYQKDFVLLYNSHLTTSWLLHDSQHYRQSSWNRDLLKEAGGKKSIKDIWREKNPGKGKYENMDFRWGHYMTSENFTKFTTLLTSTQVYSQESLIVIINKGALVIDDDMYIQLSNMLDSDDGRNHIVAMECMANSNLEKSLGKILLLLRRHYRSSIYGKKERNHVNFKSMLTFIAMRGGYDHISYDNIIENLMEKGLLTKETLDELMPMVKHEFKEDHDTEYFKIKTMTVSDEVKKYFGVTPDVQVEEKSQLEPETV